MSLSLTPKEDTRKKRRTQVATVVPFGSWSTVAEALPATMASATNAAAVASGRRPRRILACEITYITLPLGLWPARRPHFAGAMRGCVPASGRQAAADGTRPGSQIGLNHRIFM